MLLAHLFLSIRPATPCSKFTDVPKKKKNSVLEHHYAWTVNNSWSADPHFAIALEGRCVINRGKQPQSDVVEESSVPQVCLVQFLHGHSRRTLWIFSLIFRMLQLGHRASGCLYSCNIFLVLWWRFLYCKFCLAFLVHPVSECKVSMTVSGEIWTKFSAITR